MTVRPDADLVGLARSHAAVYDGMADLEGLVVPLAHMGLDHDLVAEPAGREEARLGLDDRQPHDAVFLRERIPVQAHRVEKEPRALVEPLEIVRIKDDARGIGIAPVNGDVVAIGFHALESQAPDYSAQSRRGAHGKLQALHSPSSTPGARLLRIPTRPTARSRPGRTASRRTARPGPAPHGPTHRARRH